MSTQFDSGDPASDAADAATLEKEIAAGIAPPKGSPRRDRLEAAHARHSQRRTGRDPARQAEKARNKATKAAEDKSDLAFVRQIFRAYSPVASSQVMTKAEGGDKFAAQAISNAEGTRKAIRMELSNKLSPALQQSLEDALGTRAVSSCGTCAGEGSVAGQQCQTCGGLGLDMPNLNTDDDVEKELQAIRRVKKLAKRVARKGSGASKKAVRATVATKGKAVVGVAVPELAHHPRLQRRFDDQLAKSYKVKKGQVVSKAMTADELKKAL